MCVCINFSHLFYTIFMYPLINKWSMIFVIIRVQSIHVHTFLFQELAVSAMSNISLEEGSGVTPPNTTAPPGGRPSPHPPSGHVLVHVTTHVTDENRSESVNYTSKICFIVFIVIIIIIIIITLYCIVCFIDCTQLYKITVIQIYF